MTVQPHVVALQETFLTKDDHTPKFEGYFVHREDRQQLGADGRGAGGLLVLARDDLIYNILTLQKYPGGRLETQAIRVKTGSNFTDILNIYNDPTLAINKRVNVLQSSIIS